MNDTPDTEISSESGSNTIGSDLRQARESAGLSVEEVAQAIKLNPRQIRLMEDGDFASLGSLPFARGFVRNYARHLKLNENLILERLHAHLTPTELHAPINDGVAMPRADVRRPLPWLMAVSPLILVAVVAAVFYFGGISLQSIKASWNKPAPVAEASQTPAKAETPVLLPVKQELPAAAPAPAKAEPATPADAAAATPPAPPALPQAAAPAATPAAASPAPADPAIHRISLTFKEEAWLDIKDATGRQLEAHLQRAGSSRSFEGKPPFAMVVGNADKVELRYDDQEVDLRPYTRVNVARLKVE